MNQEYSTSNLIETFTRHATEFEESQKELKIKYPDLDIPDQHFNISRALACICEEIEEIKRSYR